MAIIENVTREHFVHRFMTMRPKQFSYGGLSALYDYLDDLSEDMHKDIELDVIAICCEYAEYDSIEEVLKDYDLIKDREDLENNTVVIDIPNDKSLIIGQF